VRPHALAALVPLAVLAGACSGDDDDGGWFRYGRGSGLDSIAAGLAMLPDTGEDEETIAWGDLVEAAEVAGVEWPPDATDADTVNDYLLALTGVGGEDGGGPSAAAIPPETANGRRPYDPEFAEEVGWSIVDVDRFVERQTPPGVVAVLEGSFDEDQLNEALGEPQDGTWTVGDGEPFAVNPQEVSPARPLGQSLWLARTDNRLTVARSPEHSAAVGEILAGHEDTPTLADDPALSGLAAALDAESPYAAMLARPAPSTAPPSGFTPEAAEARCAQADIAPEPTAAVGTAIAEDDGPVILVALAHTSPEAADANAEALERMVEAGTSFSTGQAWSELVRLDDVSVTGDGLVALARLRPDEPAQATLWYELLLRQDSLIASGTC
jgi:hypothetical protein